MQNNRLKRFTYEAGVYSVLYIVIGAFGLLTFFFDSFFESTLITDPLESLILILIAIIYFRGFLKLKSKDSLGMAYIFVAAIMGLLLGGLTFLNFAVNGFLRGTLETLPFSKIFKDYFSFSIIVGSLSIIPLKDVQSFEDKMIEK
ncbi:MAG: hypothetical protein ACFFB2_14010 [Promethearchaeota archaeon]